MSSPILSLVIFPVLCTRIGLLPYCAEPICLAQSKSNHRGLGAIHDLSRQEIGSVWYTTENLVTGAMSSLVFYFRILCVSTIFLVSLLIFHLWFISDRCECDIPSNSRQGSKCLEVGKQARVYKRTHVPTGKLIHIRSHVYAHTHKHIQIIRYTSAAALAFLSYVLFMLVRSAERFLTTIVPGFFICASLIRPLAF